MNLKSETQKHYKYMNKNTILHNKLFPAVISYVRLIQDITENTDYTYK
jgi:hypothetical protein